MDKGNKIKLVDNTDYSSHGWQKAISVVALRLKEEIDKDILNIILEEAKLPKRKDK